MFGIYKGRYTARILDALESVKKALTFLFTTVLEIKTSAQMLYDTEVQMQMLLLLLTISIKSTAGKK